MKKRIRRKFRSKVAYTLVELVVTIGILGIVSGFGVGIFASVLRNYSTASVTAKEQEKALMIENFIVTNARVATKVKLITSNGAFHTSSTPDYSPSVAKVELDGAAEPVFTSAFITTPKRETDGSGGYNTSTIKTFTAEKNQTTGVVSESTFISYEGVDHIDMKLGRMKTKIDDENLNTYYTLEYTIVMQAGYTLRGTVVMYNADGIKYVGTTASFAEQSPMITICDNDYDTGIAFIVNKSFA